MACLISPSTFIFDMNFLGEIPRLVRQKKRLYQATEIKYPSLEMEMPLAT